MTEDIELLQRYATNGSEQAFTELVHRHFGLVYSAALRKVAGDAHLAQDVTQKVFTELAREAVRLTHHPVLGGWLYRSALFNAADVMRAEHRRRTREQEAQTMHELTINPDPMVDGDKLRPVLDEVMGKLNDRDRDAVILRFFEGRPFAEVGQKLQLTEDAARMRVDRALDKMRTLLMRRGVTSTTVALTLALTSEAVAAVPPGLVATVTNTALSSAVATTATFGGGTATTLYIFHLMNTTKAIAILTVVFGLVALNFRQFQVNRKLEGKISAAQKAKAKPNVVVTRKTTITQGGGREEVSLAILQAPGKPILLRKVGNKFYPLTVDDIRNDPDLMKQLTGHHNSMTTQMQSKLQGYGMAPEDLQSVYSTLGERDAQAYLLFLQYSKPDITDEDLKAFDAERRAIYNEADAKISSLINNPDNFADFKASMNDDDTGQQALQTYTSNLKRAANTVGEDLSLSPEQSTALSGVMQEELANSGLPDPFLSHLMQATGIAVMTPSFLQSRQMKETGTDITAYAPEKATMLNHIMERAAQILTPAQLAVFQQNPPDLMTMQMRSRGAQYLSQPITSLPFGNAPKSGQLTIFPASAGGSFGIGGGLNFSIKPLPTSQ